MSFLTYPVGRGEIGAAGDGSSRRDNAFANVMEIMRSSLAFYCAFKINTLLHFNCPMAGFTTLKTLYSKVASREDVDRFIMYIR